VRTRSDIDPHARLGDTFTLCTGEQREIQALDRSAPVLPIRHGTAALFAAFGIADGTVAGALHRRHRAAGVKQFLATIGKTAPEGLDIHSCAVACTRASRASGFRTFS